MEDERGRRIAKLIEDGARDEAFALCEEVANEYERVESWLKAIAIALQMLSMSDDHPRRFGVVRDRARRRLVRCYLRLGMNEQALDAHRATPRGRSTKMRVCA